MLVSFVLVQVFGISVDCPDMINLALSLHLNVSRPIIWNSLQIDCCGAAGVICSSQRVTSFDWHGMGLYGSINGSAIPGTVTYIFLHQNQISGNIPSILPSRLQGLYLYENLMSGDVPTMPSPMAYFIVGPQGGIRKLTGSVALVKPRQIVLNNNWITDLFVQDPSEIQSIYCDISNSPLLGNPHIVNLTMCTQTGLYSATLLPNTVSTQYMISTSMAFSIATGKISSTVPESVEYTYSTIFSDFNLVSQFSNTKINSVFNSYTENTFSGQNTRQIQISPSDNLLINFSIAMLLRVFISLLTMLITIRKTPFKREFIKMTKKITGKYNDKKDNYSLSK